jgi:hypothetical protein
MKINIRKLLETPSNDDSCSIEKFLEKVKSRTFEIFNTMSSTLKDRPSSIFILNTVMATDLWPCLFMWEVGKSILLRNEN